MTLPQHALNDGTSLPAIGLGTYGLTGPEGVEAITCALQSGYRLLDTAVSYGNEREVGEALRRSQVPREDVVVTTKVPGRAHERGLATRCVQESLQRLGLDQVDLVLIHWPNPRVDRYVECWQALVDLQERELVRSVGVSSFTEPQLQRLVELTGITPAVNQVELHPAFPQPEMRAVHAALGIRTQSWSPLGRAEAGGPLEAEPVVAAAQAYDVTPAQVVLRWHLQLGAVPLPRSASPERQRANLDLEGFELTREEMDAIARLARPDGRLWGGDPETHEEL